MPDIRYIVLSDTHLGAHTSLLTHLDRDGQVDPSRPSEPLACLANGIRALAGANQGPEKPALILNGDVIELALATTNDAVTCYRRLLEALMPPGTTPLFSRVAYLPGNHDHHVWAAAREQLYCAEVMGLKSGGSLPRVPHTTPLLGCSPVRVALLDALAGLDRVGLPMEVFYPNLALRSGDGRRLVVFHHGHFLEPLYSAMSRFLGAVLPDRQPPRTVAELEADNGAWIDFFWSSMGRSGSVGPDMEVLYEKLQSPTAVRKLLSNLARAIARRSRPNIPVISGLESFVLDRVLVPIAMPLLSFFRGQTAQELGEEEQRGLVSYLAGPLRLQILEELGSVPPSVAFAFGHTHRAFARELAVPGFGRPVQVFNTGGWVVDSPEPQPLNGASMLLVSEDLEIASIRLYAESPDPDTFQVQVNGLCGPDGQPGPFQQRVAELVKSTGELWRAFSRAAGPAVAQRRKELERNVVRAV